MKQVGTPTITGSDSLPKSRTNKLSGAAAMTRSRFAGVQALRWRSGATSFTLSNPARDNANCKTTPAVTPSASESCSTTTDLSGWMRSTNALNVSRAASRVNEGRGQEAEGRRDNSDGDLTPPELEPLEEVGDSNPCSESVERPLVPMSEGKPSALCPLPSAFLVEAFSNGAAESTNASDSSVTDSEARVAAKWRTVSRVSISSGGLSLRTRTMRGNRSA